MTETRERAFDWSKIMLPLLPEIARQCAEHLFSLPAGKMIDQFKLLLEQHPDILKALMDSPAFQSEFSDVMLTLLRATPESYRELLVKSSKAE